MRVQDHSAATPMRRASMQAVVVADAAPEEEEENDDDDVPLPNHIDGNNDPTFPILPLLLLPTPPPPPGSGIPRGCTISLRTSAQISIKNGAKPSAPYVRAQKRRV